MICEDYPCCGHRQGECQDRAEFHSEYWHDVMAKMNEEEYDRMSEEMDDRLWG